MATTEEVLVNFQGIDNVSPTVQQINQSMTGMMGNSTGQYESLSTVVGRLGGIFQGLNGLVMGVFGTMGLTSFKNMTYGLAVAREEVKGLYETVAGTTPEAEALWHEMDELTNQGYVQLDDLTQAMNVFGMSTGTGVEGMKLAMNVINDVGNRAIQMGYDSNRQQLLMQAVAKGLNGQYQMLNVAFGITKQRLLDMGWSGNANDIEGYVDALQKALNTGGDMSNLLDSTQGKVVSLQKRFRIAGRNIGNEIKPIVNMLLDSITELNAKTDDAVAKFVILGTGAMSGFASILPTLDPLIRLHDIFSDEKNNPFSYFNKVKNSLSFKFSLGGVRSDIQFLQNGFLQLENNISPISSRLNQVKDVTNDWVTSPLLGYLKQNNKLFNDLSKLSISGTFDNMTGAMQRSYYANVRYSSSMMRIRNTLRGFGGKLLNPIMTGLNKMGESATNSGFKILNFAETYGSLGSKMRVALIRTNLLKFATHDLEKATELANIEGLKQLGLTVEEDSAKVGSIIGTQLLTDAHIGEALAREDVAFQMAIENNLRLWEMGLISDEVFLRALYELGIIDEATARELNIITVGEEAGAKGILAGITGFLIGLNWILIAQVLLVVGAVIGLIVVIEKIGETLGWWDSWGEMLNAIITGIKRLWDAFINNPNVQGFIKDIQGLFGTLGGTISWVAWQVLQFFGWEDDGGEVDIVRGIIDVFGALGDMLGKIVNAVKWFFTVTAPIWKAIFTVATIPIRALIGLLKGIYCIIFGCSPGIIPAIQRLRDIFMSIFPYIAMALGGPIGIIIGLFTGMFKNIDVVDKIRSLGTRFYSVARQIGQMLWNGLNSVIGGIPQKVWNTFMTMVSNLTRIPQMVFNKGKEFGQNIYNGMDSAVSGLTGGLVHLPGATNGQQNARTNARTMGNATKNYNNSRNMNRGHIINIGHGAIQLDARNLTTKESKQIMINALEGLTTYETVHTKKAKGSK